MTQDFKANGSEIACETTALLTNSPHASLKRAMHVLNSYRLWNKQHKSYNDSDYENSHGSDALLYMTTLCTTTCLTPLQGQMIIRSHGLNLYIYTQTYTDGWILKDL